jgi:PAS domain S-box-containing protein
MSSSRPQPVATATSREFAALVDSVRDYAIFMLARDGTVLTWNQGAHALKGYRPDEIIGTSFSRFYTEGDRAAGRPQELLATAIRDGRVEDEGWRVRKDGTRFWADVVITPVRDARGEVDGFIKVTRDLTARRAAEEELRRSEERVRLLIESVRDYAIFMIDPQGRIATWNLGAERTKGYRADEIIGESIERFYTPEDRDAGRPAKLLAIAARDRRVEDEGWRVRKDGTHFWADVIISRIDDSDGRLLGFAKVTRDLTDRRRAEEAIAMRASEQAAIADLGVFALRTTHVEEVIERAMVVVREHLQVASIAVRAPGVAAPGALAVEVQDDPPLTLVVEPARPLTTNDVNFVQTVANVVATAIARRRTEEQLRAAEMRSAAEGERAQHAERAVRERDEFISVAAHELRTPLAALRLKLDGVGHLLRRDSLPPKETLGERIGAAVRHTERMVILVDRLLDVSRIVAGRLEIVREHVDLAALVRDLSDGFREQAAAAGCDLTLDVRGDTTGEWDPARLEQVVINLLSNALKYGRGKPVELRVHGEEEYVRLTVRDHGIGISPADADRIFGRFERAVPSTHYGGLGLGLYVTRHIVESHGGTIRPDHTVGEGACFVVELPRLRQ